MYKMNDQQNSKNLISFFILLLILIITLNLHSNKFLIAGLIFLNNGYFTNGDGKKILLLVNRYTTFNHLIVEFDKIREFILTKGLGKN